MYSDLSDLRDTTPFAWASCSQVAPLLGHIRKYGGAVYHWAGDCVTTSDYGRNPRAPSHPHTWKLIHEQVKTTVERFAVDLLVFAFSDGPEQHYLRGSVDPSRLRRG